MFEIFSKLSIKALQWMTSLTYDFSPGTKKWHAQFKFALYNKQILSNLLFVSNNSRQVKRTQQESKISLDSRSRHSHYVQDVNYERLIYFKFKGALSNLRQFLANESPLKVMKNAFYFTLKGLFVLKIFKFLCWLFDHI